MGSCHVAEINWASRESGPHHFLRRYAENLPRRTMHYAFRYLSDVYRLKRFHAFLDVALIRTDVEINQDEDCIGAHMQRVGDALKAVGRFGEAARVYCESAETHLQEKNDKTTLYNSAGHAFTRSREFPLRKKAFVQALYFGDESNMWDLESKEYTKCQEGQCLEGLYYLYGQWRLEAHEQDRNTTMSCDAEKISVAFVALCHAAKLSCAEDNPMYMCLKPKFHAKKAAKRSLTAACRYQDVHTFRKEVISCLIVGFRPEMLGPILRNKENERDEDVLRDVRLSRDYLKSKSHGKGTVRRTCANLNCEECENEKDGNIFMNCPCKAIFYCSKPCQVNDWKRHKEQCRWYAEKKAGKRGKVPRVSLSTTVEWNLERTSLGQWTAGLFRTSSMLQELGRV